MEVASNQSQATSTQLVNAVWDREVRTAILNQQFEELGLEIACRVHLEDLRVPYTMGPGSILHDSGPPFGP